MYRLETGLAVGNFAPDFSLKDATGKKVKLSSFRGKVNVLLAFYRGESDLYSINWLNALKEDYLEIRALMTDVLAISADKKNEAVFMKDKYALPFRVLPDPECRVIREYLVYDDFTGTATCAAFIVDRSGKICHKFVSGAPPDLPQEADILAQLRKLV